ncbi:hypothetical protein GCM10011344_06030 [Dokdonia pacifica]|uniref:Cellobiose phosphorylase n=1 Tax=Dokdonia pacifica TaxID=1627892 RepID=A0A238ZU25_9FLAO|nr:hypothetical protein [Dokdonia pacifica]GGG08262.1 hypothetical protein GCM10011344_06030 [Dokdonia pacifica]SNR86153.1 hypothetical protein SAMN06265376_103471 [Dokdonia pacifica]
MTKQSIYIGNKQAAFNDHEIKGELLKFDNEVYYKISNSDQMRPFFMSIISNSNHWMFIASNGGLSAGRKDSDNSLFPYYTDDKITESADVTGSKTLLKVQKDDKVFLWEPFSNKYKGVYDITRNLYKNTYGNKVIFEEHNTDLGLTYRYQWSSSDTYGFVKKSTLINNQETSVKVTLLDGLQNIVPYGVGEDLQKASSNLVDAYKRNELIEDSGVGLYALSAIIVDKAEPSEALKSNIIWSLGIDNPTYLVSSLQLESFRRGETIHQETDVKAERGAYFVSTDIELQNKGKKEWILIADVNHTISSITEISEKIKTTPNLMELVQKDIDQGTTHLLELAGASDGMQLSDNKLRNTRHFSNTLFNIMRGGIFDHNYQIEKWDFKTYITKANITVFEKEKTTIEALPDQFSLGFLKDIAAQSDDPHFKRLCLEYMPLKFSRRHGDPSRPWNKFSINTRSEVDGSKILDYEGNWRDIFQNWEALSLAYPDFIESMIHKFLNATTFDGYNPYRVTKGGFDWETIEEDNPWAYIGYWGDHQIIYLQKFLEIIEDHHPGKLASYFDKDLFVYANVPYIIKEYTEILKNPKDTIDFDFDLDDKINKRRAIVGVDGALLHTTDNEIYNVNLIEKILATVLAKISNFIPEAGIWLNTQRPEWNDANNALVGNGVSMVTLYYLRRFLHFFGNIIANADIEETKISKELHEFYTGITYTLSTHRDLLNETISDTNRKTILDGLGTAASTYRTQIYKNTFSGKKETISLQNISDFITTSLSYIEHTIDANKREDNLYHAYNLMTVKGDHEIAVSYLEEMLEGQVSVLSSGYLSSKENLEVLDALKSSALFREDQYSYLLYPNKELAKFLDKNQIPEKAISESKLLQQLLDHDNVQIVQKDIKGTYHFNGNFNNAKRLNEALDTLDASYQGLVAKERQFLLDTYELVFNHKAFTGRSGTFFGYEGLGSIYWHMVSKLLLAAQECCLKAIREQESDETIGRLLEHYYEINEGIGVHKSPKLYGAFPTDPYSHTPAGKGAQQPGMTGQVKEDILSRFGELGVFVNDGKLQFSPYMLRKSEFLNTSQSFDYIDINLKKQTIHIPKDAICFTYCQIPVIYTISEKACIEVRSKEGTSQTFDALHLDNNISKQVFSRTGDIVQIHVSVTNNYLK